MKFSKKTWMLLVGIIAALALAGVAAASVTFDSTYGTGFAGKGDVQTVLGMNNSQIQNATLNFTYDSTVVSEVTWDCTNANNEHVQPRLDTTTTSIQGIVDAVARVRNQITGYNLNGYSGTPSSTSSSDGPPLNSCPATPSTYYLSSPAGDPQIISSTGGLFVNGVALPVTG